MSTNENGTARSFELHVLPQGDSGYALALYQERAGNGGPHCVVKVQGDPLRAATDQVLAAIKRGGYRPSDLRPSRSEPFRLNEEDGVRLGLLFLAVRPLRKPSRLVDVAERVRGMATEELYYWFSKSTASGHGRRAQRALRILISDD